MLSWADRWGYECHWRYTSNRVKVFKLDAIAFAPFGILLFYKSMTVFILGVLLTAFFGILQHNEIDFPNFVRMVRVRFGGFRKPVKDPVW